MFVLYVILVILVVFVAYLFLIWPKYKKRRRIEESNNLPKVCKITVEKVTEDGVVQFKEDVRFLMNKTVFIAGKILVVEDLPTIHSMILPKGMNFQINDAIIVLFWI